MEMVRFLKRGGVLFVAHLKSVEEVNRFHQSLGGPVSNDFLPHPERVRKMMTHAGLFDIDIINQPGKFLAKGRKI
jgi:hypothetical protein